MSYLSNNWSRFLSFNQVPETRTPFLELFHT
jgi:hypothetical protein